MNVFTSYYYVIKNGKKEKQVSNYDYGKLTNKEFVKELHESLDTFLQEILKNKELQDLQTEFIVNLCVPSDMGEKDENK